MNATIEYLTKVFAQKNLSSKNFVLRTDEWLCACIQWNCISWEILKRRHQLCNEKFWQMQGLRIMDLGNKCLLRGKLGSISNTYVHSSTRWNTTQFSGILAFKKRLQKPSNNASWKMKKSCVLDQYKYMVYVENYIP